MSGVQFSLREGMKKREVLKEAKNVGLDKSARKEIKLFFKNDDDKMISNGNELAILTKFFDGSGKVLMPQDNTEEFVDGKKHSLYRTENKNTTTHDTLIDYNNDNYADVRFVQKDVKKKDGRVEIVSNPDTNLDGVPEDGIKLTEFFEPKEEKDPDRGRLYTFGKLGAVGLADKKAPNFGVANLGIGYNQMTEDGYGDASISAGMDLSMNFEGGVNFPVKRFAKGTTMGVEPYCFAQFEKDFNSSQQSLQTGVGALLNLRDTREHSNNKYRIGLGAECGYQETEVTPGINNKNFYASPRVTLEYRSNLGVTDNTSIDLGTKVDLSRKGLTFGVGLYF